MRMKAGLRSLSQALSQTITILCKMLQFRLLRVIAGFSVEAQSSQFLNRVFRPFHASLVIFRRLWWQRSWLRGAGLREGGIVSRFRVRSKTNQVKEWPHPFAHNTNEMDAILFEAESRRFVPRREDSQSRHQSRSRRGCAATRLRLLSNKTCNRHRSGLGCNR